MGKLTCRLSEKGDSGWSSWLGVDCAIQQTGNYIIHGQWRSCSPRGSLWAQWGVGEYLCQGVTIHPFSGHTHHFLPTCLYKRLTVKSCSHKGNPSLPSFFLSFKSTRVLPMVVVQGHFIPSWPLHFQVGLEKSGILYWRWSSPARSCCNQIPLLWMVKWYWRNTHLLQLVWLRAWLRGTLNKLLKKYNITVSLYQREYVLYNSVLEQYCRFQYCPGVYARG